MTTHDYEVRSTFANRQGEAVARGISIPIDGAEDGAHDAFNPVELLLSAVCTCLTKGVVRAARMNNITVGKIDIAMTAKRQDAPPKVIQIGYHVQIETEATDQQLDLIRRNIEKFGTITNTVSAGVPVTGDVSRL